VIIDVEKRFVFRESAQQVRRHLHDHRGRQRDPRTKNKFLARPCTASGLFKEGDQDEFREWNPNRSKLCAFYRKGGKEYYLKEGISVLYLGAASGTTVSHISDIVGKSGRIYAVEFSARSLRELVQRLASRENVIPMFADATKPHSTVP